MPKRCQQTAKLWKQRVENWKSSGLSQKKWCEQNSIAPSSLQYWRSKSNPKREKTPQFTEVVEQAVSKPSTGLRLQVGGAFIEVDKGFDEETLRRLVTALGGV